VSARNRSNLSIKDECSPDSDAEKCGFSKCELRNEFRSGFALPLLFNGLVMCSGRHNELAYALPQFNLQCLSILKAWLPPGWGKITNSTLVT
jgi:hypothetical protein